MDEDFCVHQKIPIDFHWLEDSQQVSLSGWEIPINLKFLSPVFFYFVMRVSKKLKAVYWEILEFSKIADILMKVQDARCGFD